jgi:hypothetical protein
MYCSQDPSIVPRIAADLQRLRNVPKQHDGVIFPRACRKLLYSIAGNSRCVDCGNTNPDWASVTYGVLLCVRCSGAHRSYGVATSRVRSISMDGWSHSQVLAMLEGGNEQLQHFFQRHQMANTSSRYKTKAAKFYRTHLEKHVKTVGNAGLYKGREASRNKRQSNENKNQVMESRQPSQGDERTATTKGREKSISELRRVDDSCRIIAVK